MHHLHASRSMRMPVPNPGRGVDPSDALSALAQPRCSIGAPPAVLPERLRSRPRRDRPR
jgi:hypothetical protein